MKRVYLDNAATSWPKPESVYLAVDRYQRELGAASGRGAFREATVVQRLIEQTRRQVAELINAGDQGNLVFTYSATDALCTAILGVLREGDHVVTSVVEHNSVLRPLRHLENQGHVSVSRVGCDLTGRIDAKTVLDSIQGDTRMVVLTHASNVTACWSRLCPLAGTVAKTGSFFWLTRLKRLEAFRLTSAYWNVISSRLLDTRDYWGPWEPESCFVRIKLPRT